MVMSVDDRRQVDLAISEAAEELRGELGADIERDRKLLLSINDAVSALANGQAEMLAYTEKRSGELEKLILRSTAAMNALVAYVICQQFPSLAPEAVAAITGSVLVGGTAFPQVSGLIASLWSAILDKRKARLIYVFQSPTVYHTASHKI